MTRQLAWEILQKYVTDPKLIAHSLATESTMQALARYYGEDEEAWGITGLLHDGDYELCKGHPEKHGKLLFEKEPNAIPTDIEYAISAHNYPYTHANPQTRMDWAITCCDELTSIIIACANLIQEKKLAVLTNDFIIKKLRDTSFLKHADRTNIFLCEEKLGIPLIEFVTIALTAMQEISAQLEPTEPTES